MTDLKNQLSQHGNIIAWGIILLLVSGALFLFSLFLGEMKEFKFIGQGVEFRNTITVSGKGEVVAVPDVAQFSFAVVKEAKTVASAQEEVTTTMNDILVFLEDFGVKDSDVKTTNYNIVPRYEYIRTGKREFIYPPISDTRTLVGYEVSHWVEVKVRAIGDVGEAIGKVGGIGATNISNVNFTIEDDDKVKADAQKEAIEDAREKARVLARSLGVRLIKIVNFSEYGRPIYYQSYAERASFGAGASIDALPSPEIPAGENTITSNVTIVYAIE